MTSLELHFKLETALLPNPSIERTRTGRPRYTASSFYVPRGLPARAAHVKR